MKTVKDFIKAIRVQKAITPAFIFGFLINWSLYSPQELLNSSSSSLVLPAVDHQAVSHLRDYFQDILNWTLANVDGVDTSQLFMVNASQPNLFVVKLQPVRRYMVP